MNEPLVPASAQSFVCQSRRLEVTSDGCGVFITVSRVVSMPCAARQMPCHPPAVRQIDAPPHAVPPSASTRPWTVHRSTPSTRYSPPSPAPTVYHHPLTTSPVSHVATAGHSSRDCAAASDRGGCRVQSGNHIVRRCPIW